MLLPLSHLLLHLVRLEFYSLDGDHFACDAVHRLEHLAERALAKHAAQLEPQIRIRLEEREAEKENIQERVQEMGQCESVLVSQACLVCLDWSAFEVK